MECEGREKREWYGLRSRKENREVCDNRQCHHRGRPALRRNSGSVLCRQPHNETNHDRRIHVVVRWER